MIAESEIKRRDASSWPRRKNSVIVRVKERGKRCGVTDGSPKINREGNQRQRDSQKGHCRDAERGTRA